MEQKKLLFVFNPHSGKANIKKYILEIIDIFVKNKYNVTVYPSQGTKDIYNKVLNDAKDYNIVVCSGGDGTLNETVNALMQLENQPLLGYIPSGTTNDFAYSVGIIGTMADAAKTVVDGIPFACDIGSFNGSYFSYVAAFGAFTEVTYKTPQQKKNTFGHLAYVIEGIKHMPNIKPYHIKLSYNDTVIEDDFILGIISNSISIGGYRKFNEMGIILDDGLFEVTLVRPTKNPFDLQNIITSVLTQKFDSPYLCAFKTSSVKIESVDKINWTLDGEDGGIHNSCEIINIKQAIKILVNRPTNLPLLP